MSTKDLLTQEEVEALLTRDSTGDSINTNSLEGEPGSVTHNNMQGLRTINEDFSNRLRKNLYGLLRRDSSVLVDDTYIIKHSDYVSSLKVPSSVNFVEVRPLNENILFIFEPEFVFSVVDVYFGGTGTVVKELINREFTPTEQVTLEKLMDQAFVDLKMAWEPILSLDFQLMNSGMDFHFTPIASNDQNVIVSTFNIDLKDGGGIFQIVIPYSMLEPMSQQADSDLGD